MTRELGKREADCKHEVIIGSAGLKVCLDCGAPMNALARKIAARVSA